MNASRRRWFRFAFSLRALFAVVGVLGVGLAWLALESQTVRRRASMLTWCQAHGGDADLNWGTCLATMPPEIGWVRRKFGDRAVHSIEFEAAPAKEIQADLARLFPEADLGWWGADGHFYGFDGRVTPALEGAANAQVGGP